MFDVSTKDNIDRVWDIIEKVSVCMLTTQFVGGLRARPLEARPDRDAGLIFFVTDIVAPVGRRGVTELLHIVADSGDKRVPEVARACLAALGTQLLRLKQRILEFDRMIMAWHRSNQTSKRLHYIPGVGPMLATALVASVADPMKSGDVGWLVGELQPPT